MTNADQKIIFTAMGFVAVLLSNVPEDKQEQRALALATLIENFCKVHVKPDVLISNHPKRGDMQTTMERMVASLINDNQKNKDLVRDALSPTDETIN